MKYWQPPISVASSSIGKEVVMSGRGTPSVRQ